jgi:hypothetical protein
MKNYLFINDHFIIMSEEDNGAGKTLTPENVGMGLAFLGMVLFVAFGFLFWASMMMPQMFNMFAGPVHFVVVTALCLALIIGGYFLTKYHKKEENNSV